MITIEPHHQKKGEVMSHRRYDEHGEPISYIHLRGFGSLPKARTREIARLGGTRAHELGRAHQWNKKTARAAGLKGVAARRATKRRA